VSDAERRVITLHDGVSLADSRQIVRLDCPADIDLEPLRTQWKRRVGDSSEGALAQLRKSGYDHATEDDTGSYHFTVFIGFVRWLIRHHGCTAIREEYYYFSFYR
jgi:hypothetical protein